MKTIYVPRVNQLDAIQLDNEIFLILKEQLSKALQAICPEYVMKLKPEIDLILYSIIWKLSVHSNGSTFGQQLLSITYDRDKLMHRKNLILHFLLNNCATYLRDSASLRLTRMQIVQNALSYLDITLSFLNILNFFRFIKTGVRPSLVDYALGLDYITYYGNKTRNVGYTHMTRELIWGGFMELLGIVIPLINYNALSRRVKRILLPSKATGSNYDLNGHAINMTKTTLCAYCNERPVLPHEIGCVHVFCYYCATGNVIADDKFECTICRHENTHLKPVSCV